VHEHILAAIIRLDKTEAFLVIEKLHGSLRHITLLSDTSATRPHVSAAGLFEILRKAVKPTRHLPARPSCLRQKLNTATWGLSVGSQGLPGTRLEKRLAIWPTGPIYGVAYRIPSSLLAAARGHKASAQTLIIDRSRRARVRLVRARPTHAQCI
jgi:hypothetical protein